MSNQPIGSVLLVDDDDDLRFILLTHLRAIGFTAFEATNGEDAVRLAESQQPDLIIMDVGLPGMDGIAATRSLKNNPTTEHIPVIILTARSMSQDVVQGLEAGAHEYLAKPFDVTELLARVQAVHKVASVHKDLDLLNAKLEAEVDVKARRLQILYDYMRELNRSRSRERTYDLIVDTVEKMTCAKRLSLLMYNASSQRLVCVRSVGIESKTAEQIQVASGEGIAGQVFRTGTMLTAQAHPTSAQGTNIYASDSFLSTPIVSASTATQDGVIGVLNVTDISDRVEFSDEEIDGIRSIADAAAIAFDNLKRQAQSQDSVRVLLQTVGHLAEFRDEETTKHLERVTKMSRILGLALKESGPYVSIIDDEFVRSLVQAAPMHDIGKVGIPDEILTKPGKLTDEEYQIMKTHADIGRRVLSRAIDPANPVPLLEMCIEIAHCHHERYDGNGYPRRIAGKDIPLAARIIALVDAYDAITSHRRYSGAKPHALAVDIIRKDSGKHFDPAIVETFLQCHESFDKIRALYSDAPEEIMTTATN